MRVQDLNELDSLTGVIVGEAAGEDIVGKMAVACVVRNRLLDPRWPNTWKGVIFQKQQFSCMNGISRNSGITSDYFINYWGEAWWKEAHFVAFGVLWNWFDDITHGANHYYAHGRMREPWWAVGVTPCYTTGGHTFYDM